MKKIIALFLSVMMLFSATIIYAEDAITEEVVANISVTETDSEEITTEEEAKKIPRIIGTFEEKNDDRTILYVAPDGKDSNSGTIESPFATVTKAQETVRSMKKAGTLGSGGAVVYFRGGTYTLTEGVKFTKEDSGSEGAPVIYRNYPDEKVEFIGAIPVPWDAFKPVTDENILNKIVEKSAREHIVAANLKSLGFTEFPRMPWPGPYSYWANTVGDYLKEQGYTESTSAAPELVVNDRSMTVARYPNEGQMTISEVPNAGTNTEPFIPFTIGVEDDRVKYWGNATEAILTGTWMYSWGTSSTLLGSVDAANNRITAKFATHHRATVGQLFHIFNLIEEIDIPGEYYLDRESGMLYFYPPAEEIKDVKYTVLEDIMFHFTDAEYVTLKGVEMKFMRYRPFYMDGNAKHCSIENCDITYGSSYSAIFGSDCKVIDCNFYNTEGGVEINGGDRETLTRANNLIENCSFVDMERLSASHVYAVMVGGVGNTARHNYMAEAEQILASLGGNENLYEYNEFTRSCLNADDVSALYAGRNLTHRGNIVRYNYFHDIGGANRGANGVHGIFFDDYWSAADVVGNVFANITGAGCMTAGSHNVFSNNIYINCGESLRLHASDTYGSEENLEEILPSVRNAPYIYNDIWLEKYPTIANVLDENGMPDRGNYIEVTNNVMYNTPDPSMSERVLRTAIVGGNVSFGKDPGFYDLLNENYLLKPDSEVYEKIPDFVEIPFTRIGTYSDRAVTRAKKAYIYCLESPYVMKNGKIEKSDKIETFIENDEVYIPLRSGAEAIDATVDFNEETYEVIVASDEKTLSFTSGGTLETSKVNGLEYVLEKPIINKNYTNYIALKDLVNIFEKHLVQKGGISVISNIEGLFNEEADEGLLRYIEAQLSIY